MGVGVGRILEIWPLCSTRTKRWFQNLTIDSPFGGAMSFVFTSITGMFADTEVMAGFGLSSDDPRYRFGFLF
jgi:hypothetical protein